jgi:hypothetical protein
VQQYCDVLKVAQALIHAPVTLNSAGQLAVMLLLQAIALQLGLEGMIDIGRLNAPATEMS